MAVAVPSSNDARMCYRVDSENTYADGTYCSFGVKNRSNENVDTWIHWLSVGY